MRLLYLYVLCAAITSAQAAYEIHVYEYEPLPFGAFTYEAHTNYSNRFQFSSELTAGITEQFRIAAVALTSDNLHYDGFHVLPHFYAPSSWGLPFSAGFVAEFGFERNLPRHIELRPILEKHIGRLQIDTNPVMTHRFKLHSGWSFEPAARLGWDANELITPSFEYYGLFSNQPVHQIYPGADLHLTKHVTWNLGLGFGLKDSGSRVIWKSRMEFEFGRHP